MEHYLLLCRSITQAQRMEVMLTYAGVRSVILRPPMELSEKGCGYAIRIRPRDYEAAVSRLRSGKLLPERVVYSGSDGKYREIML